MIAVATSAAPPLRLQLGTDCIARVEGGKLAQVGRELEQWRSLALSADHDVGRDSKRAGAPS
jgi:hypothetical protein